MGIYANGAVPYKNRVELPMSWTIVAKVWSEKRQITDDKCKRKGLEKVTVKNQAGVSRFL